MGPRLSILKASTFSCVQRRGDASAVLVALLVGCSTISAVAAQNGGSELRSGPQQSGSRRCAQRQRSRLYTPAAECRFATPVQDIIVAGHSNREKPPYLRLTTKIDLPADWKLGLLGQAAFVDKENDEHRPAEHRPRGRTRGFGLSSRTPSHLRRTLGLWIWRTPRVSHCGGFARKRQVGGYAGFWRALFVSRDQIGNLFRAGLALGGKFCR